ncbi:MAG: 50S ribosomal protein L35 [Clostridia bacterium]|nr:50S ribosomal protein L35 [Clostridia bacterium]
MPKMKTHRATAKRVKITATGKIKRSQTNKRHLLNSNAKTSKRKARLRKATLVDKTMAANVKKMLPYGN